MFWLWNNSGFNADKYKTGTQRSRILRVLRDFNIVPLPYFLYLKPRIAGHTAIITVLRHEWFIIENHTKLVTLKDWRHERQSEYELIYDPVTWYKKNKWFIESIQSTLFD